MSQPPPLYVLNPWGKDQPVSYAQGVSAADAPGHPPVNYHGYAACTGGKFERDPRKIPDKSRVLLLLRKRMKPALAALRDLKGRGCKIAVTLKESGMHQAAQFLADARRAGLLMQIAEEADGCLSSTFDLMPLYSSLKNIRRVKMIPTPYPLGRKGWKLPAPQERRGVFIGTREFSVPSRNHALAILLAAKLKRPVTILGVERRQSAQWAEALRQRGVEIESVKAPLPYPEYLSLMNRHRIIFQLDSSGVPGQVAGDALVCGIPCVGGSGTVERLVFTENSSIEKSPHELMETASRLLTDDAAWHRCVDTATQRGEAELSFESVAPQLREFFESL